MKKGKSLSIVGIGPGRMEGLTLEAEREIRFAETIVGYPLYISLIQDLTKQKEVISTTMREEIERVRIALDSASKGRRTALICSGDAGIYGMASLAWELSVDFPGVKIQVIAGVTAACSGSAILGAPLGNDFCSISLSDYLTPWERIEKRIRLAAAGDFVIVFYNPASKCRPDSLVYACNILLEEIEAERPCGVVRRIGRQGQSCRVVPLAGLRETSADMQTVVFIGNSATKQIGQALVTPRGYGI